MDWIKVIITEMLKGNFSFLILVTGTLQFFVMLRKPKRRKRRKRMNFIKVTREFLEEEYVTWINVNNIKWIYDINEKRLNTEIVFIDGTYIRVMEKVEDIIDKISLRDK